MTTPKPEQDYNALLKRSLLAIEQLKAKIALLERASGEPIAIVGAGCRLPGGANDMEAFWDLIAAGGDTVTEVPPERWDVDEYYDPDPNAPGKTYSRWGSFVEDFDRFDPDFFGISPREAISMDPQQRLLLEVAWEAMENAAIAPAKLIGSTTGVYVGITTNDYANRMVYASDTFAPDVYASTGTTHSTASGRLSYVFGFHGPNLAVDTACSSSLVATHLAIQALRNGETNLALACGVNLTLSPLGTIYSSAGRMASFDGRCKTFDAAADGYVRGEGCVVLVLKRLSDARRDRDRILAIFRGTAINQDGRSSGLTAPFGPAQEAVIRAALANGNLSPNDVSYVEAHGTGTSLGDPIELKALGEAYGRNRDENSPLLVGSVKTNIGHLEGTSGVTGVLKVLLAMQHRMIPPHLHLRTPNPLFHWDQYPIAVPIASTRWDAPVLRAGVSSFGFSGTNGHMIMEEAPPVQQTPLEVDRPRHLLPLSAQTPNALMELVNRYAEYLTRDDAAPFADVATTAAIGRSHFNERLSVVASSGEECREKLLSVLAGEFGSGISRARAESGSVPEVVFLFTGQGAQRVGMARQLYDTQPAFRQTLDQCAAIADQYLDVPLLSVIFASDPDDRRIDDTAYTQPALFVIEYALAQLWRSWGIEPAVVLGHSVGEYVAACVAGVFSLEDALRLITARGRLMGSLPRTGSMAAIFADEKRVIASIHDVRDRVAVAGANGPESTVIAGETAAVDAVLAQFATEGVEFQKLNVSHAFHSPLMDPILEEFERITDSVVFSPPRIGLVSNVSGRMAGDEIATGAYWRQHIREAVRFADSLSEVYESGYRVFLEIGPSPTLLGMARRCLPPGETVYMPSLVKGRDDWESMLDALGALYVRGARIDWSGFDGDYVTGRQRVALPTYPFKRERFWLELGASRALHHLIPLQRAHPLLNGRLPSAAAIFETSVSVEAFPYLADHWIGGLVLFPGTAYLEMARAAAREVLGDENVVLSEISIREALVVPDRGTVTMQVVLTTDGDRAVTFEIFSAEDGAEDESPRWRLHVAGRATQANVEPQATIDLEVIKARCTDTVDVVNYYSALDRVGANYGPMFQSITEVRRGAGEVLGRMRISSTPAMATTGYSIHPALLDGCFQMTGLAFPMADDLSSVEDVYVPIGLDEVDIRTSAGSEIWCHITRADTAAGGESAMADLTITDIDGRLLATVRSLEFARFNRSQLSSIVRERSYDGWLFETAWRAAPTNGERKMLAPGRMLIFADVTGYGNALAAMLRERGHVVELITPLAVPTDIKTRRIDFANADQVQDVVAEIARMTDLPFHGCVYLRALDEHHNQLRLPEIHTTAERLLTETLALVKAMVECDAQLWIVTRGSQPVAGSVPDVSQAPLWGFAGVVASEYPTMACTRIDVDPVEDANEAQHLADVISSSDNERQIALRSATRYVARLVQSHLKTQSSEAVRLDIPERGQLDNLALVPIKRITPKRDQVEIRVHATGLNFRDVLNALGMYPGDPGPLGNECAGVVTAVGEGVHGLAVGDEVISMVDQSFATYVIAPAVLTVPKPRNMSFAEAATIPVTFLTADYALNFLSHMKAGDRVLVHAAAGGVGMAAIQLARRAGADIFGTAGSPAKRETAHALGADHVADSRSLSFVDDFDRITDGEGVDIALNSLAGEFIPKTLGLLRPGGRFVEIGKTGVWDPDEVESKFPGVEYHVLYLGAIAASHPELIRGMLINLLKDFETGVLRPLPQHIFPLDKAVDAFRFMAQARHTGKIVITQRHGQVVRDDATYLITGGLGGLGLTVARWLASEGARTLVLMGRSEPSAAAEETLAELEQLGVRTLVARGDVASLPDVTRVLDDIEATMPPLRGIIHAAGVVDDGMLPEQTWTRIDRVLAPKLAGAWNLHVATEAMPLDFFVLFSSGAALLGAPGQSNYAAANQFLDALAHLRHAHGLPALSIDWGSWSDVGMAAEVSEQHHRRWAAMGMGMISPEAGVVVLRQLMERAATPQIAVLPLTLSKLNGAGNSFHEELMAVAAPVAQSASDGDVHGRISDAPEGQRVDIVSSFLREQLIKVLALDPSYSVDRNRPIMEMGIDSLMAMELRNRISANLKVTVSVAELLQGPTIQQLAGSLLGRLIIAPQPDAVESGPTETDAALLATIDTLTEDDLDLHLTRLLTDSGQT